MGLAVAPRVVIQGQTLRVRVWSGRPASAIRLLAGSARIPLHRHADGYQAFVGTSPLTSPGRLSVRVEVEAPGRREAAVRHVRVRRGIFGVRRVRLPPDVALLLDPERVAYERRRIAEATAAPLPQPLWDGPFRLPAAGSISSGYGVRSIYNGVSGGYHLGVDFPAPEGAPVRAAQRGVVTLAEALPLSGNTVVLDHGAGIFTTYQHLSAIAVAPGERVAAGQVVGQVGSTGLATGPHLHWGMRIHGVRVNPLDWTR